TSLSDGHLQQIVWLDGQEGPGILEAVDSSLRPLDGNFPRVRLGSGQQADMSLRLDSTGTQFDVGLNIHHGLRPTDGYHTGVLAKNEGDVIVRARDAKWDELLVERLPGGGILVSGTQGTFKFRLQSHHSADGVDSAMEMT